MKKWTLFTLWGGFNYRKSVILEMRDNKEMNKDLQKLETLMKIDEDDMILGLGMGDGGRRKGWFYSELMFGNKEKRRRVSVKEKHFDSWGCRFDTFLVFDMEFQKHPCHFGNKCIGEECIFHGLFLLWEFCFIYFLYGILDFSKMGFWNF